MRHLLSALMIVLNFSICIEGAQSQESFPLNQLDSANAIYKKFLGFGVEWDSQGYPQAGINSEDFAVIQERLEWMRLPIARVMMQCKWSYIGGGQYDWEGVSMKALYRQLDFCQKMGITVLLTDWGCEPAWLRCPDVADVGDKKYAEIIGTYLDYLLNEKKYSCIKYFVMGNEPNYEVKDWDRWKKGVGNVYSEFAKRELDKKLTLTGPDISNSDEWYKNAVIQLQNVFGAYDVHRYTTMDELKSGKLYEYFLSTWQYALQNDRNAYNKPFIVSEAGVFTEGSTQKNNPLDSSYMYGLLMADYAIQAVNAGSQSVLAWMLDDNSYPNFNWGMWTNKKQGSRLKPWFYVWSLLCRYFLPGSHILDSTPSIGDVRVLTAYNMDSTSQKQAWSYCIVNRADTVRATRLHFSNGPRIKMQRYVYGELSQRTNTHGYPISSDTLMYDLNAGIDILCQAKSVTILTSLDY